MNLLGGSTSGSVSGGGTEPAMAEPKIGESGFMPGGKTTGARWVRKVMPCVDGMCGRCLHGKPVQRVIRAQRRRRCRDPEELGGSGSDDVSGTAASCHFGQYHFPDYSNLNAQCLPCEIHFHLTAVIVNSSSILRYRVVYEDEMGGESDQTGAYRHKIFSETVREQETRQG